jgi:hypothetical protein
MDSVDATRYLARNEAKRLIPLENNEGGVLSSSLARIHIDWGGGTRVVRGSGHEGHDNEDRMDFLCRYLERAVLPYVETRVKGAFPIQLHDSYTYLEDGVDMDGVLTFSKNKNHAGPVLLPDIYHMTGYAGWFDPKKKDELAWEKKEDVMYFSGTTTGHRDPLKNERVRACVWSLKNRAVSNFRLCKIAQIEKEVLAAAVPQLPDLLAPPTSEEHHCRHKFLVNVRGNTCCWARVPMIFKSKSIMLNLYHEDVAWYYPLMQEGTHYVSCTLDNILQKREQCLANPVGCKIIAHNANAFYANYLSAASAALYAKELFETAMELNAA